MAAEQVLGEQQFAGPALEPTQVHSLADEVHPARLDVGDLAEGDEQITPGDARDQTGDGRMGALADPHDQILDAADLVARLVDEGAL